MVDSELKVVRPFSTSVPYTDDAVGLPKTHWYIAIVGNRAEKKIGEALSALGYETYVATQNVSVNKNGSRRKTNRIVFPALVFVRATEAERTSRLVILPFIKRFMTDPARRPNPKAAAPVAFVPDEEMETLMFMLTHSESPVSIECGTFKCGDRVQVISGGLKGLVGTVCRDSEGRHRLSVSLDILGCANVEIDRHQLQLI